MIPTLKEGQKMPGFAAMATKRKDWMLSGEERDGRMGKEEERKSWLKTQIPYPSLCKLKELDFIKTQ